MKKILLFIMLLVGFGLSAQTVTLPTMAAAAANNAATYQLYQPAVTTNIVINATTVRSFIFTAPQPMPTTQDYTVKLDSVSGNHTNVAVALYGQKSAVKGDWVQIGSTVNWKGTTADTVITISNATANRYQNYKSVFTGTGAASVSKATIQELKLRLE